MLKIDDFENALLCTFSVVIKQNEYRCVVILKENFHCNKVVGKDIRIFMVN